jgi:hypothetical protein
VRPLDTSPEVHRMQIERYRRMSGEERVALALRMTAQAWRTSASGIRSRHPEYSNTEVDWALARLRLGDEIFREAWPAAPVLSP